MTIQGAMKELVNLLNADDIPVYYKGGIEKVIETIDDYIDGKDDYVKRMVDRKTEPSNSEIPNNCKAKPRKEQNFCGKCRYLYRDFKYGLSCYRLMDNEPCKYEERKDEPQTERSE